MNDIFLKFFPQLVGIGWMDKENRERAFFFLFENFRKFYLPHIFQDFNPSKTLYDSSPGKSTSLNELFKDVSWQSANSQNVSFLNLSWW